MNKSDRDEMAKIVYNQWLKRLKKLNPELKEIIDQCKVTVEEDDMIHGTN